MKWLTLIFQYLPSVLATVVAVEGAIGSQPGATKKQVAMNILTAGATAAQKIPNADVAAVAGLVDTVVTTLNASGVFTKGNAAIGSAGAPAATGSGGVTTATTVTTATPLV